MPHGEKSYPQLKTPVLYLNDQSHFNIGKGYVSNR